MVSIAAPIDIGQFDDAPEGSQITQITREGNAYIDTYIPASDQKPEWPETSEDEDDNESEEYYDRVEDEDWENAERGAYYDISSFMHPSKIHS